MLLFGLAAGVAFFNLIVPLLAWEKKPRAKETILFLAIGILVCITVLSVPCEIRCACGDGLPFAELFASSRTCAADGTMTNPAFVGREVARRDTPR